MYNLKERLLDKLLTESVGFKRAFDSDYHHNEFLISFHRNDGKSYVEEYRIHGTMSHALKHLIEFLPSYYNSFVTYFREKASEYVEEQYDLKDMLKDAIANNDKETIKFCNNYLEQDFIVSIYKRVGKFKNGKANDKSKSVFLSSFNSKVDVLKMLKTVSKYTIINYFDYVHDKVKINGIGSLTDFEKDIYNKCLKPIKAKYKQWINDFEYKAIDLDVIVPSKEMTEVEAQSEIDYQIDSCNRLIFSKINGNIKTQVILDKSFGVFAIKESGLYTTFYKIGKKSKEEYYAKVNDSLRLRPDTRKIPITNKLVYKSLIRYYSPK